MSLMVCIVLSFYLMVEYEAQIDTTVPRTLIAYRSLQLTPFLVLVVDLERYSRDGGVVSASFRL